MSIFSVNRQAVLKDMYDIREVKKRQYALNITPHLAQIAATNERWIARARIGGICQVMTPRERAI